MAKGIIYCMTTIVPGLVKIGKTGKENFEARMYHLERNGYANVVGLKRNFAIEVEDYDEKETLIHELFSKSKIQNTELFAVDVDLVVQLLSSLEGTQIFPKTISKEEVFSIVSDEVQRSSPSVDKLLIPNGLYYLNEKVRGVGLIKATMQVENGKFTVLKGSQCLPCNKDWMPEVRKKAIIEEGVLIENIECNSPSTAGWVVLGFANNGWKIWKTEDGTIIDIYRKNK